MIEFHEVVDPKMITDKILQSISHEFLFLVGFICASYSIVVELFLEFIESLF